jgi:aminomethyltransferase
VYRFKDDEYLLVVNAANIDKDWEWCVKQSEIEGLEIGKELINISDDISQLAVQGPYAYQ